MSTANVLEIVAAAPLELTIVQPVTSIVEISAPRGDDGPQGPQGLDGFIVAEHENDLPPGLALGTVWVKPV